MSVAPVRPPFDLAIVGMGLSGAAAAAALLRAVKRPFSLALIEEGKSEGEGLAYGAAHTEDLLNVRARDLTLFDDEPGQFSAWLKIQRGEDEGDPGQIFAQRRLFGRYIRGTLVRELTSRRDVAVRRISDRAVGLGRRADGAVDIRLRNGEIVSSAFAILAVGYGGDDRVKRFGLDPYREWPDAGRLRDAERVTIVGAGLTMADVLLRLRREGAGAAVTIISRRGLTPLSHLPESPPAYRWPHPPAPSARRLSAALRAHAVTADAAGAPWQGVIGGFRPHVEEQWRALSVAEQARILRHIRPYWDIHRHRIPISTYNTLQGEIAAGKTAVRAGRVERVAPGTVDVRFRGADRVETIAADLVFDCSGHRAAIDSGLLASAARNGWAVVDPHRLGLDVAPDGRVRSPDGRFDERVYAMGPLGAGALFEITGAPEIVKQAKAMAARVAASLKP